VEDRLLNYKKQADNKKEASRRQVQNKRDQEIQEVLNYKLNLNINPSILKEWKEKHKTK